jgi:hypothetical protein
MVIFGILIGLWLIWAGWKFYRRIDWAEPADPSPDLAGNHKREAQLLHIQEVLEESAQQGKISQVALQEVQRFCEREIQELRDVETTWKNRHKAGKA